MPGSTHPLKRDLYDTTTEEIIEVKSSSVRGHIRYAIGQVLDYARHVEHRSKAVLVPSKPADDLINLLTELGIVCVFETSPKIFERIEVGAKGGGENG